MLFYLHYFYVSILYFSTSSNECISQMYATYVIIFFTVLSVGLITLQWYGWILTFSVNVRICTWKSIGFYSMRCIWTVWSIVFFFNKIHKHQHIHVLNINIIDNNSLCFYWNALVWRNIIYPENHLEFPEVQNLNYKVTHFVKHLCVQI